ncbi:hypothetical protein LTR10_003592 [Elasticomyces elasticus]|nr:hypothetical protein LTR10_003592 [Elasticomyces elasticus]KAK4978214.1 hypothetical protein LTR42_002592 [Elasticomyces elasticus]
MPPTSNTRRTSLHPPPPPPHDPSSSLLAPSATTKRTSSGRAIRSNANRPSNYYARTTAAQQAAVARDEDGTEGEGVGFFPAIQYFSNAVVALPREVMKQFTLVKEVEAKIYSPALELEGQLEGCLGLSVPTRGEREGGERLGGQGGGGGGMLSFTASNSIVGGSVSKDGSLLNGFGGGSMSILPSAAASVIGEDETATTDPAADEQLARRRQFLALRQSLHALLPNLDEKNVVLAEANRVLAQQLSRVDSVWPHVENEISEEARWGSMKHWAYSDNRAPRHKAGMVGAGAGRGYGRQGDVAATNSLVAAANMVHESEIAAARREAMRDGKVVKGKRAARDMVVEAGDSDFEEPRVVVKKAATKGVKKMAATAQGLGITGSNGEAVIKRRKVDKGLVAPGMERSNSSATAKGGKTAAAGLVGGREGGTPRSTPSATVTESNVAKKVAKTKPAAPVKKRAPGSAHQSPAMASSPLHGSFGSAMEPPPPSTTLGRTGSTRLRQNSTTNLRHQSLADAESGNSRPVSSAGGKEKEKEKGSKTGTKRKARVDDSAEDSGAAAEQPKRSEAVKREDSDMPDAIPAGVAAERPATSRSSSGKNSSSNQASGRARGQSLSKTSTPRADTGAATFAAPSLPPPTRVGTGDGEATTPVIPGLARARSTRSRRNTGNLGESSASDEPKEHGVSGSGSGFGGIGGRRKGHGHERTASNSHILRQLMPFNRSPELKERGKSAEGEGEDGEDGEGEGDEDGAEVREGDIVEGGVEGQDGEGEGNDGQGEVGVDGKANRVKRVAELMKKSPGERVGRGGRVLSRPELMVAGRLEGSPSPVREGEQEDMDGGGDEMEIGEPAQQEEGELGDEEMRDEDGDIDEPVPEAASPGQEQNDALPSPSASPSPPPELEEADPNALSSPSASPSPQPPSQQLSPEPAPELDADIEGDIEGDLEEDEDEDHDPDDPNEPKYCYCNRGSYGEMVACDNDQCEREWFHIGCTELLEAPGEDEGWWCDGCRPRGSGTGGGGRGGRGRGR